MTPPQISRSRSYKPEVEILESRLLPTVTYHGGALLPHVQVQPLFLGPDWATNPVLNAQASVLSGFCNYLVHSSYMDLLKSLGYRVGRGTCLPGFIDTTPIDKGYYLLDTQIEGEIKLNLLAGNVAGPSANRLYVVFVEPGVGVHRIIAGGDSTFTFGGYHYGMAVGNKVARYALIPYPGYGNVFCPTLSALDTMTLTASHEIAEAVTDPDGGLAGYGAWFDGSKRYRNNGEIGDINPRAARLGPYVIQSVADKHDVPRFPAKAVHPTRFAFLPSVF